MITPLRVAQILFCTGRKTYPFSCQIIRQGGRCLQANSGNPTKSVEINDLIKTVNKKEVR